MLLAIWGAGGGGIPGDGTGAGGGAPPAGIGGIRSLGFGGSERDAAAFPIGIMESVMFIR